MESELITSEGNAAEGAHNAKRGQPEVQEGVVVSNKMTSTVVVQVTTFKEHAAYKKYVKRSKKYMAHDEQQQCNIGDKVEIVACKPMSRHKRWRVRKIVEKAVLAEV